VSRSWGWIASFASGVAASIVAAYIYDGQILPVLSAFVIVPLIHLAYVLITTLRRIRVRSIHARWESSGNTTEELIRKCKATFRFMTVTGRTSLNRAAVEAVIKERGTVGQCNFRFLLLHPLSPHLEAFCENEGSSAEQTRIKIVNTTRALYQLAASHKLCIEIRWYQSYPIWRLALIDNSLVYAGYYEKARTGYEGPVIVCANSADGGIYYPFSLVFEDLWNSSQSAQVELDKLADLAPQKIGSLRDAYPVAQRRAQAD
jgi:hypothetical protein